MKWDPQREKLSFSERDLRLMKQCKMTPDEVLRAVEHRGPIVPLWSVLSFVMLMEPTDDTDAFWKWYREVEMVAKCRDSLYCEYRVPKHSGGKRTITTPSYLLRRRQAFIAEKLLPPILPDPHAYAYRKGMSVRDCAAPHLGKQIVIHLDIRDFFGSIREDMVFAALLRETGYSKKLVRLLSRLCCYKDRLPQGACTSPALSNIVFKPCDEAIGRLAESLGMDYTRYSDDLYLSSDREGVSTTTVIGMVRKILADHGYRLHEEKTKILRQQHRQNVVGVVVNEKLQPSREYRRKLLQELYYVERFGGGSRQARAEEDYHQYLMRLQGKVSYVRQFLPEDPKFLEAAAMLRTRLDRLENFCAF